MIITDQIADMLTRIRNASIVRHDTVEMPASKMKLAILKILKEEGFIIDYELIKGKPARTIKVRLKYLVFMVALEWRSCRLPEVLYQGNRPAGRELVAKFCARSGKKVRFSNRPVIV